MSKKSPCSQGPNKLVNKMIPESWFKRQMMANDTGQAEKKTKFWLVPGDVREGVTSKSRQITMELVTGVFCLGSSCDWESKVGKCMR